MDARKYRIPGAGFTLVEVLVALGLCALLATATASATAFAARRERAADRHGAASLLVPSLYAAARLRPDDPPDAPAGWRLAFDDDIVPVADELRQEWRVVAVADADNEIPPFMLRILNATP